MNTELAEEIARLAAPIFAALLAPYVAAAMPISAEPISAETLKELRHHAITQARALWLDVQDAP